MTRGRALRLGLEGAAGLGRAAAPESAQRYKRRHSYSKNGSFRQKSVRMTTFATTGAKKFARRDPSSGVFAKKLAQHATKRQFWAIFRALGELFRAHAHIRPRRANFFAHRTRPRANFETNDASAVTDAGQHETAGTTARPQTATIETGNTTATEKCTKNSFFSPAKAMAVSTPRTDERAKATGVSRERFPMYAGYGGACPDNEPTRRATHQRPGAAGVEGAGGTGGHGRASRSTTPSRRLACGDLAGGRA